MERLKRDLRFANERADDASRNKSSDTSSLIQKYNRQLTELEDSLRSKQMQIDDLLKKLDDQKREHEMLLDDKDAELQVMQESMDSTLQELGDAKVVSVAFTA
jgi:cell division FtsZ-interacting protein ZapD